MKKKQEHSKEVKAKSEGTKSHTSKKQIHKTGKGKEHHEQSPAPAVETAAFIIKKEENNVSPEFITEAVAEKPKKELNYTPEDYKQLFSFLQGQITPERLETYLRCKPKKKLSIFVSSTFTDTYRERSILHEVILPDLQNKAKEDGVQVLFYDMRFGIKDESVIDHSIWNTCQEGIRQCMEESDGMFFLSLQGDKYGYRPLPRWIENTSAFEELLKESKKEELRQMAKVWYLLDKNQLTPRYELKNLRSQNDSQFWTEILPTLREQLLKDLPFDPACPRLLIDHSITEWEMLFASDCGSDRCAWIRRDFDALSLLDLQKESNGQVINYCDSLDHSGLQEKVSSLKREMSRYFETIHPVPLKKLSVRDYLENSSSCQDYLDKWRINITNRLSSEVEDCVIKQRKWKDWILNQTGLSEEVVEEMCHHHTFAARKASNFIGRESLLREVLNQLQKEPQPRPSKEFSAIAAVVIGQSGAGKTALMAKLASMIPRAEVEQDQIPIIMRFCGTSRYSLHGKDLLQSIILQLLFLHRQKRELEEYCRRLSSQSYERTVRDFSTYLKKYPVVLLIDSLDQLSNQNEARSSLLFLRNLNLHPQSRVLVSSLPDEYDEKAKRWKYCYGCETTLRESQVPIVEMKQHVMDERLIRMTISSLLTRRQRKLSLDHWEVLISAASVEPTMLYLNLSVEILTKWRSFERDVSLKPTVKGLIHQIFTDIERLFGQKLVTYAFAFITFSRDGMNDVEMKDCLSLQSEVFAEVCQYWKDVQSVPAHVWLRVKLMIKHLIAEKESGCVKWFHRQLWETAQERYNEVKGTCHQILGNYFHQQSITLTNHVIWHPESKPNLRKAKEGYFHLIEAKALNLAIEEICSLEMICAAALADDIFQLVTSLSEFLQASQQEKVDHYYRWLKKDSTVLSKSPRCMVLATASAQPLISLVRTDYEALTDRLRSTATGERRIPWVRTLVNAPQFDVLLANFTGHKLSVSSVCANTAASKIASASEDKTIKIWNVNTGEVLYTLEGHRNPVLVVSWSPCNDTIASGGKEGTIILWNSTTGEKLQTLTGHEGPVISIAWSIDGSRIASGSEDKSIRIWEVISGKVLKELKGHELKVSTLAWSHDGRKLASGSCDKLIKIWNPVTGDLIQTLEEHYSAVGAIAWSPDDTKLASTSCHEVPKNIFIWDIVGGKVISKWEGHSNPSTCLVWSPDGSQIVSGATDNTVKIWNAKSGEVTATYNGHTNTVNSIVLTRDGSKIISGSRDHTIKIWSTASEGGIHSRTIGKCLAWNPNGTTVATPTTDGTIGLWNAISGEYMTAFTGDANAVNTLSWSNDGSKLAMGTFQKVIQIWDTQSLQVLHSVEGHTDEVRCVVWSHDGTKLASSSADKTFKIWTATSLDLVRTIEAHTWIVSEVAWSADDSKIVSGSTDEMIKIWDVNTGDLLITFEAKSWVLSLAWNATNDIIAFGSTNWAVTLWKIPEKYSQREFKGHSSAAQSVSWSRDGSKIASGSSDTAVKVWDALNGHLINTLEAHIDKIEFVAWSFDSMKLASGSIDTTIKLWEYL